MFDRHGFARTMFDVINWHISFSSKGHDQKKNEILNREKKRLKTKALRIDWTVNLTIDRTSLSWKKSFFFPFFLSFEEKRTMTISMTGKQVRWINKTCPHICNISATDRRKNKFHILIHMTENWISKKGDPLNTYQLHRIKKENYENWNIPL